jgi:hypothetical protein
LTYRVKRGHTLARLDIFRPARLVVDDIPVSVRTLDEDLRDTCQEEMEEKLNEIPFGPVHPKFPAGRGLFLDTCADQSFEVVDEMEDLEEQFQTGKISYAEYQEYLDELGAYHG